MRIALLKFLTISLFGIFMYLGIAFVASAQNSSASAAERPGMTSFSDLKTDGKLGISDFIGGFLRPSKVEDRSANDLGWDCLAAVTLKADGDDRAVDKLRIISQEMSTDLIRDPKTQKARGWGASISDKRCTAGGYDAFGDGTCNAKETVYAFQSGLGAACLALASKALSKPEYLKAATEVVDYWQGFRLSEPPCVDCIYFATSDNLNDANRYVRNMNVFMALGSASVAGVSGIEKYSQIATKAMRSELLERKSGNRGYLGRSDIQWRGKPSEAERIENHSAAVAVLSLQISEILKSQEIANHAKVVWRDWATCDNERCRIGGCKYWSGDARQCQVTHTSAHCAFRRVDPLAASQCLSYLNNIQRLPGFGIWSAGLGGQRN